MSVVWLVATKPFFQTFVWKKNLSRQQLLSIALIRRHPKSDVIERERESERRLIRLDPYPHNNVHHEHDEADPGVPDRLLDVPCLEGEGRAARARESDQYKFAQVCHF